MADLERVFRVSSKGVVSGPGEISLEMNTASSPGAHVSGAFRVASPLDLCDSDQIFLFKVQTVHHLPSTDLVRDRFRHFPLCPIRLIFRNPIQSNHIK
jgi:hypothetical protein